jgi:hypothetical protein
VSIMALGIVAITVLVLLIVGLIVGWVVGSNDEQIDILARRLAAEQRIEMATRETLRAMRDAVRRSS